MTYNSCFVLVFKYKEVWVTVATLDIVVWCELIKIPVVVAE